MRISEFVEYMKKAVNRTMKDDQVSKMVQKVLDVKSYISIKEKKQLVKDIVNESIYYEDGVFKFDEIEKYICFTMRTIAVYTNLELSDDIEADYDALCEAKLLDVIINTFKREYDDVSVLLQMRCDYILSDNNIEAQFGKFLTNITEKLDSVGDILVNKMDSLNLDKLPFSQEDLIKVLDFVNKQQK